MDGKPFLVTNFSHSLRVHLFCEHLGIDMNNLENRKLVKDPVKNSFFNDVWNKM